MIQRYIGRVLGWVLGLVLGRARVAPAAVGFILLGAVCAMAAGHPLEIPAPLQTALDSLRNARYQQTLAAADRLQDEFPGHPLPFLIAAESTWGLIFCQTGHINSREIWNAAAEKNSPFDGQFFRAAEEALAAARALREQEDKAALGSFFEGLAHGVRARLFTLRAEARKSGREGKQMRQSLLQAAALDGSLQADADAGLGAYDYYADVLSPLIKLFRFFLFIPGGDRRRGLERLDSASRLAVLLAPEARYELAKIYGLREGRPSAALRLFRGLADEYPGNAIFSLSAALQAERIGDKRQAVELAQRAVSASRQMEDVCRVRLEPSSRQALDRLTGGE